MSGDPNFGCFEDALQALRRGDRVARKGWNGKGMFLFLVEGWAPDGGQVSRYAQTVEPSIVLPFIAMRTANGRIVPWLASQSDLLEVDWSILE